MEGITVLTDDQIKDIQTLLMQMLASNAGDKKISQLDAIPTIVDADLLAVVDITDDTTKKATAAQFKEHVKVVAKRQLFTVSTPDQRDFTLAATPSGTDAFGFFRNGILQPATAYSFTGTALTWGGVPALIVGDKMTAWYDWQAPSPGLFNASYSGTMPAVASNLLVTAAQLGLDSARQIVMGRLEVKGTDNLWFADGNNVQTATKCDFFIPSGAHADDGNLYISTGIGATTVASQPFEFAYFYQSTNFLS